MPSSSSPQRRVVITGYGMITPLGRNAEETFANAAAGRSGVRELTSFDTKGLPCRIGGEIPDEWLASSPDRLPPRLDIFGSRGLRLMVIATAEAVRRARLHEITDRASIGVALGSHGDNPTVEEIRFLHRFFDGAGSWDMKSLVDSGGFPYHQFLMRKPDAATAMLSMHYDCKGPNHTVVSACAAGAQAIGEAFRMIREGSIDTMIAGGCESTLNFTGFVGFVLIKALCEKYTSPEKASRPFDRKRNGFVMSEGAGAVVLEELEHARGRRAPILGEIIGYGDSADAYRITDTHPRGEGAILAMKAAIASAGLTTSDIEYINAHGTSTIQNDLTETRAIKELFGDRAKKIPVSSNKSMMGHTIAAAGAIECILTAIGIERSIMLPTINHEFSDPKCDLDYVPNEARHQKHFRALSNSFGFGGQNACLCISGFEE
ncbi:MAG: beta-ketoacyl-[acyl-carrier-protein] synthase family protein [Thermodesulfovibrionales bacterium]